MEIGVVALQKINYRFGKRSFTYPFLSSYICRCHGLFQELAGYCFHLGTSPYKHITFGNFKAIWL